jgi:hypothetical protein
MIEIASCVGTVKYIRRGISAISYEIALDTNSVTADGNTGKFLTTKLGKYHFLKHTGNKTEDCTDVLETFNFLVLPIDKNGAVLINGRISGGASGDIYDPFFDESIKEEDVSQIKFFWYSAPVAEAGNFNYIKALTDSQGVPTKNMPFTILASNTFLVVRQGADGPQGFRGSSGPVWRQHVGFVSATADAPYQYYTGSNDERFIDVVLIGKVWYRCLQSYKSTGTADARNTPTNAEFAKYWTSADMANFTFIATQFLLADNAKINLFGSNEINLYNDNENGTLFASFRVPSGKWSDAKGDKGEYVLWIGAADPEDASYYVKKNGVAKMDCCYFGQVTIKNRKKEHLGDANAGIYYGEKYYDIEDGVEEFHPYVRSAWICDKAYTFGLSADNVVYEQTGWGGYVKMWQMNGYDNVSTDMYNKRYPRLPEAAMEIRKSLSGLPKEVDAYDCIGISLTSIGNVMANSIGLDISTINGQNSIGLRIDASGGSKANHAIQIVSGDIAGLRPYIRETNISTTLSIYDHTVYCTNSGAITLTLPRSPIKGQEYLIIQGNGRVNIEASHVFFGEGASGSTKTWWSGTKNQFSWLIFTGSVWVVQYAIR